MRKTLILTILTSAMVLALQGIALAVPPPEDELPVNGGFSTASFFDDSGDGITDGSAPLLGDTPFYRNGLDDGFATCGTSPLDTTGTCSAYAIGGTQFFTMRPGHINIADLGMQRDFKARAGQNYRAAALVALSPVEDDPGNLYVRLTVVGTFLDSNGQVKPECNDEIKISKDLLDPVKPDPVLVPLAITNCEVLVGSTGLQKVAVKVRLHAHSTAANGTMAVRELSFYRCENSGCLTPAT